MRDVHIRGKLKHTEKARVVVGWLLHYDRYVRQYYSKCYNREAQVENFKNVNRRNFI